MAGVSPRLTVHAIDTFHGVTGAGLKYEISRFEEGRWQPLKTALATQGGRPSRFWSATATARAATKFCCIWTITSHFSMMARLQEPALLAKVPLRFAISDASHRVHVAALFSPWGYWSYRGS